MSKTPSSRMHNGERVCRWTGRVLEGIHFGKGCLCEAQCLSYSSRNVTHIVWQPEEMLLRGYRLNTVYAESNYVVLISV
jgi:hypothetical protein